MQYSSLAVCTEGGLGRPYFRIGYCRKERCSNSRSLYSFGCGFMYFPIVSLSAL